MQRPIRLVTALALALLVALLAVGTLSAAPGDSSPGNKVSAKLRKAVDPAGILVHERRLQRIANANEGNRGAGTSGYDASADYVAGKLREAGYRVTEQPFEFPFFQEREPAELEQVSPTARPYETATFTYSGSGDVTGRIVPIGVQIPPSPTPGSTSGCEPEDFEPASATDPEVALIQRGTCTFGQKASNAQDAGYDAVVIFNEGQEGRQELLTGTLGAPDFDIPVVGASFADGQELYTAAQAGQTVVRVFASTLSEVRITTNVIADYPKGNANQTVVVGAHLDSVIEGAGINDNGSGTAQNLEIALEMAKLNLRPANKVRFGFWGAEELGLLGSEHYVGSLNDAQLDRVALNLNFDMTGSPNYVRFVYDGDGSETPDAGPAGSAQIENVFNRYFRAKGLETDPTAFDGRSDYGPFIAQGIPAGGLFTGAEGVKTAEQAAIYGGTAAEPYDPCYHRACDDITNLSVEALDEMSDAAAHATINFAADETPFTGTTRAQKAKPAGATYKTFKGPEARK
ncbi:MAG: Uncharacterized lipoprotein aminopeptidase LpqL [uncultured Rubrobacteraceae bacterium]|uniref:Uncharacterized lipoprotein aminopeptidase LpqL n=1 Tax=uncultured Rubrobacteraceae bacterium TaxID=349277 RepID=A0A6J4R5J5_9ACTN|nr:MAG: Uncharacterized lipoprotein aminopeptidase LpqL [uncultured Rubrobacteraceae bacterium]